MPISAVHGPAAFVGYGLHYGGAGLATTYSRGLLPWLTLSPRLGVGFVIGGVSAEDTLPLGWAAGLSVAIGRQHRGFADIGWARGGVESIYLHGSHAGSRGVGGPTGTLGYEYISSGGFVVRLAVDMIASIWPRSSLRDDVWQGRMGVGVGVLL